MIAIQNIYYMLSYAFQVLQEQGFRSVATEEFDNTAELCAAILSKGIAMQIKREFPQYAGYFTIEGIDTGKKQYPNFKAIATTLRTVKTATVNDWKAICWADGVVHMSKEYNGLEILDRVGGGDSFASGLVYGLMTTGDPEKAVNYGAAHGALAMTTPGDTSMASVNEVEAIMGGAGARVKR